MSGEPSSDEVTRLTRELERLRGENTRLRARLDQQFGAQRELAQGLGATQQLGAILHTSLAHAIALAGVDGGGVYLLDDADRVLELASHRGLTAGFVRSLGRFPVTAPGIPDVLAGRAVSRSAEELGTVSAERWIAEGLRGLLVLPVVHGNRVLGALALVSRTRDRLSDESHGSLELLCRQLGAAIARSRAKARHDLLVRVVESSTVGLGLCDLRGTTTYVNPALLRMWGYERAEQLVGGSVFDWWVDPDQAIGIFRAILSEGSVTDEMIARRADGTHFPVVGTASVLPDERGEPALVVGSFTDVTELHEARVAVRQVRLADAINGLLRRALEKDDEASLGRASVEVARQLTGAEIGMLLTYDDGQRQGTVFIDAGGGGRAVELGETDEKAGERPRHLALRTFAEEWDEPCYFNETASFMAHLDLPLHHPDIDNLLFVPMRQGGQVAAVLGLANKPGGFSDDDLDAAVTLAPVLLQILEHQRSERARREGEERLEAQRAMLRQSQKLEAIGRLAGGVAHDFNNLLAVVVMYGQGLMEALGTQGDLAEDARVIVETAERGALLTRQLLAFGRRAVLEPSYQRTGALVLDMGVMIRRLLGDSVELRIDAEPDAGWIHADPGEMGQVLLNLVVNARDAMPGGGRLCIGVYDHPTMPAQPDLGLEAGAWVELRVADDGSGMTPEQIERIFEPFYTTKDHGKGTGLGLATVYGIVKQSGGAVRVVSAPGQGSTFHVFLPMVRPAALPVPTAAGSPALRAGRETVLLAEDNHQVRRGTSRILSRAGYRVLEAANAGEALLIAEQFQGTIHALVSDVDMPLLDGPGLAVRLRQARPALRVLLLTGHGGDVLLENGISLQGARCLLKPFGALELTEALRELLDDR